MIVVRDTETLKGKRLVATIGFFDGVHLGHRFLIHELKQVAEAAGLPSAVITFPEHPRAVLHAAGLPSTIHRKSTRFFPPYSRGWQVLQLCADLPSPDAYKEESPRLSRQCRKIRF